jgi:hypothetical protein
LLSAPGPVAPFALMYAASIGAQLPWLTTALKALAVSSQP